MTAEFALKLGIAIASILKKQEKRDHMVVIGKDTRRSCYMLESALTAGLTSGGVGVYLIGPIPTPGIAMLTRSMRCDLGIMISASHNPYYDNGIKLFDPDGIKFPDKVENEIEEMVDNPDLMKYLMLDGNIGRAWRSDNYIYQQRYIEFVKSSFPKNIDLSGIKIVVDCSNGSNYKIAPTVLQELGAEVIRISCEPNGTNINDNCGSTKPQNLREAVLREAADVGVAFDGDADRVMMADEIGQLLNGDQIMAMIAKQMLTDGKLNKNTVVSTQMSNLGFEMYLNSLGIKLIRTKVGDRYVSEEMRQNGYNLGGEQSGHIILSDFSTTGDGLCSALQILAILKNNSAVAFSKLSNLYEEVPQRIQNIKYGDKNPLEAKEMDDFIREICEKVGKDGRILIRKSGTESLIRVMVEHKNNVELDRILGDIVAKIEKFL
jgi:phosphoglucosamine mutase